MKIKRFLITSFSIPILPVIALSSCSTTSIDAPTKLKKTVFETNNKNAFNDIFNLVNNQTDDSSFIKKDATEINKAISDEIAKNALVREKLRIYFFTSIYNSLSNIVNINENGERVQVDLIGQRLKGTDDLKAFINDSVKPDNSNPKWKKYDSLEAELNKITEMKINVSYKIVDNTQSQWIWETSFKLAEDSELKKILKAESTDKETAFTNSSIFFRRQITQEERDKAQNESKVDGVVNDEILQNRLLQLRYQSSKWYWDPQAQIIKSIEMQSNINPYSTNGTFGGYTDEDGKRTEFAIDFKQHRSNSTLFTPVFFMQSNKKIRSTSINSEWTRYLEHKRYKDGDLSADPKKVEDIRIDLKTSYVKYDKKI
ncbi:MAG: hypothetical protein ACRC7B_00860 [Metamycoplasmataceae bacterium]